MEIVNEYDKLCQKIWELRKAFYMQNKGIEPNTVNVGYDEFYTLKNGNHLIVGNMENNTEEYMVFGMKINRVVEDNYLSVGHMIE
jgi:hypothetical protein